MKANAIWIYCALALTTACERTPRANAAENEPAGAATTSEQPRTGCTGSNATPPCPPAGLNGTRPNRTPEQLRQPGSVGGTGASQDDTVGEFGGPQRGVPPGR